MAVPRLAALALLACVASATKRQQHEQEPVTPVSAVAETVQQMDKMVEMERRIMDPADPLSKLKEELAATVWLREQLEEKDNDMKEEVYRGKIAIAQEAVAKETTPGVARMLGDMRREMHALAAPFYSKVIREQIASLQAKEKGLLAQIESQAPAPPPPAAEELEAPREVKLEKPAEEKADEEDEPNAEDKKKSEFSGNMMWTVGAMILVGVGVYFCMAKRNPPPPPAEPPVRQGTRQEV